MDKIKTILAKEWAEVFKNRLVLFTVLFMPLMFTALALGVIGVTGSLSDPSEVVADAELPENMRQALCQGMPANECLMVYIANQFMSLFMIMPIVIPVTIAAYSIVGEKTTRSLEVLLATPITTTELLAGKALAAAIPAAVATLLGFAIFVAGLILFWGRELAGRVLDPLWILAVVVIGPLLAILSVMVAVMVSSRVSDPRVAEQLSMVVIVPVIVFFIGQTIGLFVLNLRLVLLVIPIMLLLDAGLVYLAVKTFERETILTRWK